MNLNLIPYSAYERGLPQEGNFILGQQRSGTIFVYQAFNDAIADYATANQKFGGPAYSFSRMTWIKPNFLWMMYRSGWAQKENQNRILAIEMTFEGFEQLLTAGVMTSMDRSFDSEQEWRDALNKSNVRIQWDPDHGLHGEKLKRRAVQIGIKDEALRKFNDEYIRSITDITPFVLEQHALMHSDPNYLKVVFENVIEVNEQLRSKFSIPARVHADIIDSIVSETESNGTIPCETVARFIAGGDLRKEVLKLIRNKTRKDFSRILLKTATALRREEQLPVMCDDLLFFAWFAAKNQETEDLKLVVDAKLVDFDCWCGFDGAMVFHVLGYDETIDYLKNNRDKHPEANLDHLLSYSREEVDEYKTEGSFWYLF